MTDIVYCHKCKKQVLLIDRIYSSIHKGYICMECYNHQFPKISSPPKPLLLAGYHDNPELLTG